MSLFAGRAFGPASRPYLLDLGPVALTDGVGDQLLRFTGFAW